jgi:hypothetical protein
LDALLGEMKAQKKKPRRKTVHARNDKGDHR